MSGWRRKFQRSYARANGLPYMVAPRTPSRSHLSPVFARVAPWWEREWFRIVFHVRSALLKVYGLFGYRVGVR